MSFDGVMIDRTTDCSGWIVGVQRHDIAVPIDGKTRRGAPDGLLIRRILDGPHHFNDLPQGSDIGSPQVKIVPERLATHHTRAKVAFFFGTLSMNPRLIVARVGRSMMAVGFGFFLFDLIAFRVGKVWSPLPLGGVLAALHLVPPQPPWLWLQAVYAYVGSSSVAAVIGLSGLAIYTAFGKPPTLTWRAFITSIALFPYRIATSIFTDTLKTVRYIVSSILIFVFAVTALVGTWFGVEYALRSHLFSRSQSCDLRNEIFSAVQFDFFYQCIDASGTQADEPERFFAFFIASERYPDAAARRTGHAWFGRLALRKVESSYLLTEYKITGYGYRIIGGASCQRWIEGPYSIIQPFVPTSVHQLLSAWYCNAPVIGAEGPQIEVPAGQPLPKVSTPAEVNKMLGVNKPEVLLAVAINKEQFNNIQFLVDKQIKDPRPYQLLYHDCTTFVRELAASIGLYVRPRILAAFPSETVYALMLDNLRSDEIPSGLDAKQ